MFEQLAARAGLKYGGRGWQHARGAHLGTVEAAPLAMAESSAGGGAVPLGRAEQGGGGGAAAFGTITAATLSRLRVRPPPTRPPPVRDRRSRLQRFRLP